MSTKLWPAILSIPQYCYIPRHFAHKILNKQNQIQTNQKSLTFGDFVIFTSVGEKIDIGMQSIITDELYVWQFFFVLFAISGFPKTKLVQYLFQTFFLLDTALCKKTQNDKNTFHAIGDRWLKRKEALISHSCVIQQ